MMGTSRRILKAAGWGFLSIWSTTLAQTIEPGTINSTEPIRSRITEVVVYPEQALIRRTAELTLTEGEHQLVYLILPAMADGASVQASGRGSFTLRDITIRNIQLKKVPDEKINALKTKIEELEAQIIQTQDRLNRIAGERDFIKKIVDKVTAAKDKETPSELNPDNWIKMVQFYRTKSEELDKENRETARSLAFLNRDLQALKRELNDLGGQRVLNQRQVEVKIDVKKAGKLFLDLSYRVNGPGWEPLYELRAASREKTMTVLYQALVRQNTGEDWKNVKLSLSTAQPALPSRHPDLTPWIVGFNRPSPSPIAGGVEAGEEAKQMFAQNTYNIDGAAITEAPASETETLPEMEIEEAAAVGQATAELFAISGDTSIPSDNQSKKVGITIQEFPAHFRYSAIPKMAANAYLKARVSNDSPYTFLPGDANVFLDQSFIATTEMARAAKGESFWTFLGVDEEIKVEYRSLRKTEGDKGVLRKKNLLRFESEITLTNNKQHEVEIVVWDQIPIPTHEEIKVRLVAPEYKQDSDSLKMNKNKLLEWFFRLKPAEKTSIPLTFTIEYPLGRRLDIE